MSATRRDRGGPAIGRRAKPGRGRRALRGAVEGLEPRVVMATFAVTSAADAGPGSLRDAITQANALPREAHVIEIDPAVAGPIVLSSALPTVTGEVQISAPAGSLVPVARSDAPGTPTFRILTVAKGAEVRVNGLGFSGGEATFGGGILNEGLLALSGCEVSGNVAGAKGGGIFSTGVLWIGSSTIRDNRAEGVSTIGFGPAGIGRGGGVYSTDRLTVAASTFSGNVANREGGAVWNSGTATINTSSFLGNAAESFVFAAGRVPLGRGGAIHNTATVTIKNSTLAGNAANREGGAVFSNVTKVRIEPSSITSSIVADNPVGDIVVRNGPFESRGANLLTSSPGFGPAPNDLVGVDPMLGPPEAAGGLLTVRSPLPGSPAIDAGAVDPAFAFDQKGTPRAPGSTDVGAAEALPFSLIAEAGGGQAARPGEPFAAPLIVRLDQPGAASLAGGRVTLRAPAEGASAILAGNPATFNAEGIAEIRAVSNGIPGTYEVVAEAPGAGAIASFTLTNLDPAPADPGPPAPAASAPRSAASLARDAARSAREAGSSAREAARDLRDAAASAARIPPALRKRADALARDLIREADSAADDAIRRLPPALARWADQARARNGSSSTPGTPISTT